VARVEPEYVDFAEAEGPARDEVVKAMERVAASLDGWVIFEPLFDSEALPPVRPSFLDAFSGRGPTVPEASWVPGEAKRDRVTPLSIGLRHPSGSKAAARLAEAGTGVPDGWAIRMDHPKRGLVLEARGGTHVDAGATLTWLLTALDALTPLRLAGQWRATIHHRH